jgi:hypothetical protein
MSTEGQGREPNHDHEEIVITVSNPSSNGRHHGSQNLPEPMPAIMFPEPPEEVTTDARGGHHRSQDRTEAVPYMMFPDAMETTQQLDGSRPQTRLYFPTAPTAPEKGRGFNGGDNPPVNDPDAGAGAGIGSGMAGRQQQQAMHFRNISDTTSVVAVLIATLPWALIAQPAAPPVHFSPSTTFTLGALSSSLAIILALLCQYTKLVFTLSELRRPGFSASFALYVLEDAGQMALVLLLLASVLFFFLALASYSFVLGMIFVALVSFAIIGLSAQWIVLFIKTLWAL